MSGGALNLDNPLWRFAFKFYAEPEVSVACLALQNTLGADVNLLLFGTWLGLQNRVLSEAVLVLAPGHEWQSGVVEPLRAVRLRLRREMEDPTRGEFYETLKGVELRAEQIRLALLCRWSESLVLETDDGMTSVAANLRAVLGSAAERGEASIAAIMVAAHRYSVREDLRAGAAASPDGRGARPTQG